MYSFSKKSTIARSGSFLAIALLFLAVLTAFRTGTPPPRGERAFRGFYEGNVTVPAGTTTLPISFTVMGNATHLGRFRMDAEGNLNLETLALTEASATFTGAHGDQLFTEYTSAGFDNGDGTYTVTADHRIVGGTGRFEDAEGAFSSASLARLTTTMETTTISGKVYMTGTISY